MTLWLLAAISATGSAGAPPYHGHNPILHDVIEQATRRALQVSDPASKSPAVSIAHPVTSAVSKYNVASNSWAPVAPMSVKRSDHTTTGVGSELYAAGGCSGDQADYCPSLTNVFEKYNPVTNQWSTLAPLPRQRYRHAATAIDTKLYLIGGVDLSCGGFCSSTGDYDNLVSVVDVFDTATGVWSTVAPLPDGRVDLAAFALGTKIHVVGGYTPRGDYDSQKTHFVLDTANLGAGWVSGTDMLQDRGDLCAVADGTQGYTFGGFASSNWNQAVNDLEELNSAGMWSTAPGGNAVHRGDAACAGVGDTVYVFGGENKLSPTDRAVLSSVEAYNTATNTWSVKASLPQERFRFSAAALSVSGSDFVFVTGGQLPSATIRANIPWDGPAAVLNVSNAITVESDTQLVFDWVGDHNVVRVPDAASLANCVESVINGAEVLAPSASKGLDLSEPPAGAAQIYLTSSVTGDCAGRT